MTGTQKAICYFSLCLGGGFSPWLVPQAQAANTCTYSVGNTGSSEFGSGDDYFSSQNWGWCTDSWLNSNAKAFGMKYKDWKGHGGDKPCDEDNPTGRMFTAIVALKNAGPPLDWNSTFPFSLPEGYSMLHWAPRWVYSKSNKTIAQCAKNGRPAFKNAWGNVIVYVPNFSHYQSAPQRAGTLVHEARHVEGSVHAKGGNDKRWNGNGAWSYNASWLAWYGFDASPAPKGQKCLAGREANSMYKVRFNEGIGPTWRFPACQQ